MKNKNTVLIYKILLTLAALIALLCNAMPFIQAKAFGFSSSVSVLDLFESGYVGLLADVGGQEATLSIIKALALSIMAFDVLTGLLCWIVKSKWISLLGVIAGFLQTGCWAVIVILAYRSPEMQDMMSMGVEFGAAVWGFIITGIIINVLSVTLLFSADGEDTEEVYAAESEGALIGMKGIYAGARIPVGSTPVVLGRDNTGCNVIIPGEKISRQHCSVAYDSKRQVYIIWDLSSNGTYFADGRKLMSNSPNELKGGTQIKIGDRDEFALQ